MCFEQLLSLNNGVLDTRVFSFPFSARTVFATLPSYIVESRNLYEMGRERKWGGLRVKICPEAP